MFLSLVVIGLAFSTSFLLNQLLLSSAENGNVSTLRLLLNLESVFGKTLVDVDYREENCYIARNGAKFCQGGETPLIVAVKHNQKDVVELLLHHNASRYLGDLERYQFPLEYAISSSTPTIIELLLTNETFENVHYGRKVLAAASRKGDLALVKKLQNLGAIFDETDYPNISPLVQAAANGNTEIVKQLLDQGIGLKNGPAAIKLAAQQGHTASVKALLDYLDKTGTDRKVLLEARVDSGDFTRGFTPLISASQSGRDDTVRLLLQYGADVENIDQQNYTALLQAAKESRSSTIKILVEEGKADIHKIDGEHLRTAFGWAGARGDIESIKFLIEKGSDVGHKDRYGRTALTWTTRIGYHLATKAIGDYGNPIKTDILDALRYAESECWALKENCDKTVEVLKEMLKKNKT